MNARSALRCAAGSLLVAALAGLGSTPAHAREGLGKLVETFAVDATDSDGTWTVNPLIEGHKYEIQIAGTYTYGQGDSSADAECSQLKPDPGWQRNRYVAMTSYEDVLDVYLDNSAVEWVPTERDAFGCNSFNHTYSYSFVMPETRHVRLFVRDIDGSYYENSGTLLARVTELETEAEPEPEPPASASSPAVGVAPAPAPVRATSTAPHLRSSFKPAGLAAVEPTEPSASTHSDASTELAMGRVTEVPVPVIADLPAPPSPTEELATMVAVGAWAAVLSTLGRRFRLVPRGD